VHAVRFDDGQRLLGFGRLPVRKQPSVRGLQWDLPFDGGV
jgi:hypothetical protein